MQSIKKENIAIYQTIQTVELSSQSKILQAVETQILIINKQDQLKIAFKKSNIR